MESAIAGAAASADWTLLPEEILVTLMGELEVPDLIRSGAVCTSWYASYAAFRRLRLPSPRQAPCLLYSCDGPSRGAAALYCPATGATCRPPFPDLRGLSPIGSCTSPTRSPAPASRCRPSPRCTAAAASCTRSGTSAGTWGSSRWPRRGTACTTGRRSPAAPSAPGATASSCSCTPRWGSSRSRGPATSGGRGSRRVSPRACRGATSTATRRTTTRMGCSMWFAPMILYALDLRDLCRRRGGYCLSSGTAISLTGTSSTRHGGSSCKHGDSGENTNRPHHLWSMKIGTWLLIRRRSSTQLNYNSTRLTPMDRGL
ncbi:hypothetical protein C2845_PM18G10500 [Panicum miliaceum]|uniref:F-box domain-containing protein n=1 Tax=Panicum miliaceum TaxID=4540 RepID=A0A3L6PJB4_PANMI|nr:hypothetical protein C2845_PM18G10500 [Panicum miliaceum]